MKVYLTHSFRRYADKERLSEEDILRAINQAEQGNIDADLGAGVIKQRIARKGSGKSGGYRSIIYYRRRDKAFVIYGFAKNKRENITNAELAQFKKAAKIMLQLTDEQIATLLATMKLYEIKRG